MKVVLQRVLSSSVKVEGEIVGEIQRGYLLLLGIAHGDTREKVDRMLEKIHKLRLFADADGRTNLSIGDVDGEILVVSQFTLYADCRKGTRPSFTQAAAPALAEELYNYFIEKARPCFKKVAAGQFGASMQVEIINDGPFTIVLEDV